RWCISAELINILRPQFSPTAIAWQPAMCYRGRTIRRPCMPANAKPAEAAASHDLFVAPPAETDPEIAGAVGQELGRPRDEIERIAWENIVGRAVLEAQGSVLTNKYAEGLPGRRYYGGCQFVDIAETLAIQRVTKLFGCRFANVQPPSGASAN